MANIYSNNSHIPLESDHPHVPQALQPQDLSNPFTEVEQPKVLAQDQEFKTPITVDQPLLTEPDQQVEEPSVSANEPHALTQKRWFNPKLAMITAGITAVLIVGGIASNYIRTAQYNKIDQAKKLFSETCQTTTFPDAAALTTAKTAWDNAISLLQEIPPVPGLGVKDAQELQSNYDWCKANINATEIVQDTAINTQVARNAVANSSGLTEEQWANHLTKLDSAIERLDSIQTRFGNSVNLPNSLPIFSTAQTQLQEYKQIRVDAQIRKERQHDAVQNFIAAQEKYQRFATDQDTTDSTKRETAEVNLRYAIELMREIPITGTTVSANAIERRQTYEQTLAEFQSAPMRQQLLQLAGSFRQLSSALKSSMSVAELDSRISTLADQLGQLQQSPDISRHPAFRYFQAALRDYQLIQNLVNTCAERDACFTERWSDDDMHLPDTSPLYRTLVDSYNVAPVPLWRRIPGWRNTPGWRSIRVKTALATINGYADRNIDEAERLLKQ